MLARLATQLHIYRAGIVVGQKYGKIGEQPYRAGMLAAVDYILVLIKELEGCDAESTGA